MVCFGDPGLISIFMPIVAFWLFRRMATEEKRNKELEFRQAQIDEIIDKYNDGYTIYDDDLYHLKIADQVKICQQIKVHPVPKEGFKHF